MPIIQDKYFIEDGFNGVFRELTNIEIEARPSKSGFLHTKYVTRKRDGLFTPEDDSWDLGDTIQGAAYENGVIYPYDSDGELYEFDGSILTTITTPGQDFSADYNRHTIKTAYIGGGRYPDASTEFTVASYNAGTAEVTFVETTLTADFIGKYGYIASGDATTVRQQRGVSTNPSTTKLRFESGFDVAPIAGDKFHFYNEFKTQIRYPQLRQTGSTDYFLSLDTDGNAMYRYFPNAWKIVSFNNRFVQLHKNRTYIITSDVLSYELIDLTKSFPLTSSALNITSYSGYIFVFFENKIGILVKNITDTADPDNEFVFTYDDKLEFGLFSEDSFYNDGVNLYVFGNDRRFYAIDVSISSTGDVKITATPQGRELAAYFNTITSGDVFFNYNSNKLRMIHVDTGLSTIYLFNQDVSGWYLHTYTDYDTNFMYFLHQIDVDLFTCFANTIYRMGGLTDNGTNIEQKISFEGPVNLLGEFISLSGIKFRFGFDGDKIGGKVKVSIGGNRKYIFEQEISRLQIVDEINAAVDGGTFGSTLVGEFVYGGPDGEGDLTELYNEYIDCKLQVNKPGSHYLVEIINDTDKQLYFAFAIPDYSQTNPLTVLIPNNF